ncbi:Prohibitin-1, subunit of the prohibitin complex (Phb1p-Phb2p) [Coemansia sp. RSA 989]|nr:Prohibitin-1, subunit of the prohibitin complex (Phb1p-Phb2p) [Coemansia sp. RSA 989]
MIVKGGQRAVIFDRLQGVKQTVSGEGTHFLIPGLQRAIIFDVRTRPRLISTTTGSKDMQMVSLSLRVLQRPDIDNLPRLYQNLGLDYDERVLPSIGNEVLKSIVAQFDASELITQRDIVSARIREELLARAKEFNIRLEDVSITHMTFGKEFTVAVEKKQIAQQEAERARFVVEKAEQEKLASIIRAEGEATAAEEISKALAKAGPGLVKLRRIEASREIAETLAAARNVTYLPGSSQGSNNQMLLNIGSAYPIDDEIARLTSEDVPNHELDISGALTFADRIRSKEFGAKDVARALKERLNFSNPNVQILVLNLADICVKNGGRLIQLEISRREFIDAITNLLDSRTGRDYELRQVILTLIQEWAAMFRNNNEMSYVSGVMERMKRSGYSFPKTNVSSSHAMAETESAPEWEESPVCQRCRTAFTLTNRQHHCRNCGKCFCNDCSSNRTPIPKYAIYDSVRVCHGCYLRLKKIVPDIEAPGSSSFRDSTSPPKPSTTYKSTPSIADDDEDLKRAIELSLQEAQNRPNYAEYTLQGNRSSSAANNTAPAATKDTTIEARTSKMQYPTVSSEPYPLTSAPSQPQAAEEDDPDLRAAIEASLQDMSANNSNNNVPDYLPAASNPQQSHIHYNDTHDEDAAPLSAFMPTSSVEEEGPLAATEKENIQLFESLLFRIRDSGQDIRNDPQVQYLHETIGQLHPKITGAIEDVDQKHKEFVKLHDRIMTAIKIYDQLLDKRLRSSTFGSTAPGDGVHVPAQQSLYPAVPVQQATFEQAQQQPHPVNPTYAQQAPMPSYPSLSEHNQLPAQQPIYGDARASQVGSMYMPQSPTPSQIPQQALSQPPSMPGSQPFAVSPSQSSAMLAPQQEVGMQQQQPNVQMTHTPSAVYSAPPPVSYMPNIPALQPTARAPSTSTSAMPAASTQAAKPTSPEPEEALLIEL